MKITKDVQIKTIVPPAPRPYNETIVKSVTLELDKEELGIILNALQFMGNSRYSGHFPDFSSGEVCNPYEDLFKQINKEVYGYK